MDAKESVSPLPANLMTKLGILFLSFFVLLMVTGIAQGIFSEFPWGRRSVLLAGSATQAVLAFMVPAWLTARLCSRGWRKYLGVTEPWRWRGAGSIVLFFLVSVPVCNVVVDWNASLSLEWLGKGLDASIRGMEEAAAEITEVILSDYSIGALISGILIVGCLTGLAEEVFFRGGLQKGMTSSGVNGHVAVWTSAFVFSVVHFQFFGFVPRLLLGAFFGYVYLYSGSLWLSALAHALNNSIVVVSAWLVGRGLISSDVENIGVTGPGAPLLALVSLVLTVLYFIFVFRKSIKWQVRHIAK